MNIAVEYCKIMDKKMLLKRHTLLNHVTERSIVTRVHAKPCGQGKSKNGQGGNRAVHLTHFSHSHDDGDDDDDGDVLSDDTHHSKACR